MIVNSLISKSKNRPVSTYHALCELKFDSSITKNPFSPLLLLRFQIYVSSIGQKVKVHEFDMPVDTSKCGPSVGDLGTVFDPALLLPAVSILR